MRALILLSLILSSFCADECIQHTSYETCIGTINQQCQWTGQYCRTSNNYLLGCDVHLSSRLCVKQFGNMNGTVSACIFDDHCHQVYDSYTIQCTNTLSKSACLQITNPQQQCKWEKGKCLNLSQDELNSLNTIFGDLELSASSCSLISGYLVIHSSVLWDLVGYSPDLFAEALNLVNQEAGIQITTSTNYDDTTTLQDNYVDSQGLFKWYTVTTQLTTSNLKINDYTRYGCIAQEILTDSRFLMLFTLNGVIRGVNHIYCNYLNKHPSSPILTIFVFNECRQVTEAQLQDINFINQNGVVCQSMGGLVCQRFYNPNNQCQINYLYEFECKGVSTVPQQGACSQSLGTATHFTCARVDSATCYLDISSTKGQCTNQCATFTTQANCEANTTCQWLGSNLNSISDSLYSQFIVCAPKNGCDQLGLNKKYCLTMATNCQWNEAMNRCSTIAYIEQLQCNQCNTIYCCSSMKRYDQFCIWTKNQCLNVKDQPLFSHFLSFPMQVIMNFNLCVSQTGQYNYYDIATRTCKTSNIDLYSECVQFNDVNFKVDNFECDNGVNDMINKEYCLALVNSYTRWDQFKQKCLHVAKVNVACDLLITVNPNVCSLAVMTNDQLCLYDVNTLSCKSTSVTSLSCDMIGISKSQCVNILNQTCQWMDNKCKPFQPHEIVPLNCIELINVSESVCRMANKITDQCKYDANEHSCVRNYQNLNSCVGNWNNLSCQNSNSACYFDQTISQCLDATLIFNVLQCTTDFISQSTCLAITTEGQRCYWGSIPRDPTVKCRPYIAEFYSSCDSYTGKSNSNQCSALTTNISLSLTADQYCEVVNNVCSSQTTTIADTDCGYSSRIMNVYRCMGYTSGHCYFDNYKCTPLLGPQQYQQQILKRVTCNSSNMNVCTMVLTPGQACFVENNTKCNLLYTLSSYTCATLSAYDMTKYGPQLCIRSSDECYFDNATNKCKMPISNEKFDCDQVGGSKLFCIGFTKGMCAFSNNYCQQLLDFTTACENRNRKACSYGTVNCVWNTAKSSCQLSTDLCPPIYNGVKAWLTCGVASATCFAGRNGCVQEFQAYLPCWLSLSSQLCSAQANYCQWINNQCTDLDYRCEDATTLEECVIHRSLNCVYADAKCFEIATPENYNCDDFDYTTPLFCRYYYPLCSYSSSYVCSQLYHIPNSKQVDDQYSSYNCQAMSWTQQSCIFQRVKGCYFVDYNPYSACYPTEPRPFCQYFQSEYQNPISILACEQVENCAFSTTLQGTMFCHLIPLTCEQLPDSFCFQDIPGLHCYFDYDLFSCATYVGDLVCDQVQNLSVNKQLCLSIMQNESNTQRCYYDPTYNSCKIVPDYVITTDCPIYVDIYSCTFASQACLNNYDTSNSYSECSTPTGLFDTNLNLYGCVQLTDTQYYFNLNSYECVLYSAAEDDNIFVCQQMNQNLCKSTELNIKCVWFTDSCQSYTIKYQEVECEFRNYLPCLGSTEVNCVWIKTSHQCVSSDTITTECDNNGCFSSELNCITLGQFWDGKSCYEYSSDVPASFYQCGGLGLSSDLCINNTQNLTCYWNGKRCLEANLDLIQCDASVSKQTCLQVRTPKQICFWDGSNCINKYNSTQCSDYLSLSGCSSAPISCQFNLASNLCVEKTEPDQFCSSTLSQEACKNVVYESCMWYHNQCTRWARMRYSCDQIFNKWGCFNTSMNCQWTTKCENIVGIDPMSCKAIPSSFNKAACTKYSSEPCRYDVATQRCDITLTSTFTTSLDADQTGVVQIRLTGECTEFTNQQDCTQSRIGFCEWLNSSCINCTKASCSTNICKNQNQNQCMNLQHLECAWRDNQCLVWAYNANYTLKELSLITGKCCTRLPMLIKYDLSSQSCIPLAISNDNCLTLGLSQYACLHLIKAQCVYRDGSCQNYEFQLQSSCSDYVNINQQVCQQLPHLSCKYDSSAYKCIDIDKQNDSCLTVGISLLGCSNLLSEPCYWDKNQCAQFVLNSSIDQCDNFTRTNSYTCQILNYYSTCSFNQQGRTCFHKFNKHSQCKEPGLNRLACASIIREPCQYRNNQCQLITTFTTACNELRDVNELACKMNTKDSCAYDPISYSCFFTLSQLPCNYQGLNINNCLHQSFCTWSYDSNQCQCNTMAISAICALSESKCKASNNCKYERQGNYCRVKHCDDLSDCLGFVNGERCYLNYSNECQGATKCEDIVNLIDTDSCSNYAFSGSSCIQILNYCVSASNLSEICINSNCSNNLCKMSNSQCNPLECTDYSEADCYFYPGCTLIENQCQKLSACYEISKESVCVSAAVEKGQCSWEMSGVYSSTYHCTSTYCQLYNVSPTLCNGNEINLHSCMMDQFLQCRICEEIQDQCSCSNSNGACKFVNGACKSVLCQNFITEAECVGISKCYWSSKDQVCRKSCKQIILIDECEALNYECHWNQYMYQCEQGVAVTPDLSVTITVKNIYSKLMLSVIVLLLCIE